MKYSVYKQDWEESERGWGVRPDGYSLHATLSDCKEYIEAYWKSMPDYIPDEYSRPVGKTLLIVVDEDIYKKVLERKPGVRVFIRAGKEQYF